MGLDDVAARTSKSPGFSGIAITLRPRFPGTISMGDDSTSVALVDQVMSLAKEILSRSLIKPEFCPADALVDVGFTSLDLANLMIAVETEFDIMIPSSKLTPGNFKSVKSVSTMLASMIPQSAEPV